MSEYLKNLPADKAEEQFESQAKKSEDDFGEQDWMSALVKEADKQQKERGIGACDLDDPDSECLSCGS